MIQRSPIEKEEEKKKDEKDKNTSKVKEGKRKKRKEKEIPEEQPKPFEGVRICFKDITCLHIFIVANSSTNARYDITLCESYYYKLNKPSGTSVL